MWRAIWICLLLVLASPALALSPGDLLRDGYRQIDCHFDERCLIGTECERAWRNMRWYLNDDGATAYRLYDDGRLRKGLLMKDARWKDYSDARAILMPMREAVASHLTMFDGGGAIYTLQYAGSPGSGQFLLGQCTQTEPET